jgi:hypothetical protein
MAKLPGGYTAGDLIFNFSVIIGLVLTFVLLREYQPEMNDLLRGLIALLVGLGIGFAALKIYEAVRKPPPPDDRGRPGPPK